MKIINYAIIIIITLVILSCTPGQIQSNLMSGAGTFDKMKWNNQIGAKFSHSLDDYAGQYEVSPESQALYDQALISYKQGKKEEAALYLYEAVSESPNNLMALVFYCAINIENGVAGADEFYKQQGIEGMSHNVEFAERSADLAFDVPEIQLNLAWVYYEKGKYLKRSYWTRRAFFAFREAAYLGSQKAWETGKSIWRLGTQEDQSVWGIKDSHPFYSKWGLGK